MNYKKIISTLLAVLMLIGSFSTFLTFGVSADDGKKPAEEDIEVDKKIQSMYMDQVYNTPEEKLESMGDAMLESNGYQLFVDPVSGEVAVRESASGNILFSNPYDVAGPNSSGSVDTKSKEVMSQIIVNYMDNGTPKSLYSFKDGAMLEQINVMKIKKGVRVEYTIGHEETRKLVPRCISEENYLKFIDAPLKAAVKNGEFDEFYYKKFSAFYQLQALRLKKSQKAKNQLLQQYPICETKDIYVFATDASNVEINWCETYVKNYCEDYTFEQMDADHEETGYVAQDEKFPVFKMALEYSLDENGLQVRLPCNGLRYDMSSYTLESVSVLPYMGAGNSENPGYNFYPDGSGSLFDFEQLNTKQQTSFRLKVYGTDYAYHTLTGTYQKAIRYPVYGTVATETIYTYTYSDANGTSKTKTVSKSITDLDEIMADLEKNKCTLISDIEEKTYKRGYVAVMSAGESMAELSTYHAGSLSDYNTMINYFNPKPKDSYDISDSISVSSSATWTVVSDRKYTGNIEISYRMLSDPEIGKATKLANPGYVYYDASWLGMANAYRDYLIRKGSLRKLTDAEVEKDIPLYLEVFGAMETKQTFLTIPVDVMTPLTTFENVLTMYQDLSADSADGSVRGVRNINFKMTGFANGGLYSTVPASLKWEGAVGGAKGFRELVAKAEEINAAADDKHIGLYPDADFAYIRDNTLFDSTNLKKDAVKTIDNRYTSLRQYYAPLQGYVGFYQLAVSPSRYEKFYTKFEEKYAEYGLKTLSVATLGTALNSDFDEDEPFNREDNKQYTVDALRYLNEKGYSLMTEGANAYSWGYVDHIVNVELDSSRHISSSASVPFIGAVLHGYIQFAGTPFNEEGDTDYALLKAIENGAGMFFILSYQNTSELKEDMYLSQYYSVMYDIWRDDVVKYYNTLNDILKDVQTKEIVKHEFLVGERVLDPDELEADLAEALKNAALQEELRQANLETDRIIEIADAWSNAVALIDDIDAVMKAMDEKNAEMAEQYGNLHKMLRGESGTDRSPLNWDLAVAVDVVSDEKSYEEFVELVKTKIDTAKALAVSVLRCYEEQKLLYAQIEDLIEGVETSTAIINGSELSDGVKEAMTGAIGGYLTAAKAMLPTAQGKIDEHIDYIDDTSATSVVSLSLECRTQIEEFESRTELSAYVKRMKSDCRNYFFTAEDVHNAVRVDTGIGVDEEESDEIVNKYAVDNNRIVAVTYGDYATGTEYKTFILNYNSFSVRVTYEGLVYTIPGGGYVMIAAQA